MKDAIQDREITLIACRKYLSNQCPVPACRSDCKCDANRSHSLLQKLPCHANVKPRSKDAAFGDRVSFDGDEGEQFGYVVDFRRDLGNGELFFWVELEHQWSGFFRAVAASALLSNDGLVRSKSC